MSAVRDEVRYWITLKVYGGYDADDEIVARAVDEWRVNWQEAGEPAAAFRPFVEASVAEVVEEHRREQAIWPARTDCDRLDAAFAELDARGILARQNYEQTISSACAAIWAEVEREQAQRPIRGYVFFHEQDTETAVRYDGPVLAWGAVEEPEENEVAWNQVAEEIVEVLRRHGLKCSWRGQLNSRISVDGMTWQRRR
jgi:Domain of unknown function (DUF6891)